MSIVTLDSWILNHSASGAPAIAHDLAGADQPKLGFLFTVEFKFRGISPHKGSKELDIIRYDLKTADRPTVEIIYSDANFYNYRGKVATSSRYGPLKLVFYEDSVNTSHDLLWDYINAVSPITLSDTDIDTSGDVVSGRANPSTIGPLSHADGPIAYLKLHHHYITGTQDAPKVTTYTCINPKIQQVEHSTLDMRSSDAATVSVTFTFEGVSVEHT